MSEKNLKEPSRHIFAVVSIAMGILVVLSAIPWSRLTGNKVKDFNLFEDLIPSSRNTAAPSQADIDPELESFLAEEEPDEHEEMPSEPQVTEIEETPVIDPAPAFDTEEAPRGDDGEVLLECYGDSPLAHFKAALEGGSARVAVLGDSFIEGDIFTQDLRSLLQDTYGGNGIGYAPMHTDFPGFRSSVHQSDAGWKMHDLRNLGTHDTLRTISGEYGRTELAASATYKAGERRHADSWERSRFLFISPDSGTVTLTTTAGPSSYPISPSGDVQILEAAGSTRLFKVETDINSLIGLGVYLDGTSGIQVDCMSIRGNSGIGHRKMNLPLAAQMRRHIDYDLIILEYGINALSGEQTDYTPYGAAMKRTVGRIRACYPEADIIIMGIADRGAKDGSTVHSLPTCAAMVRTQRDVARSSGCVFWDTREAMGGDDAVIDWRKRKLMNADYIHINHDGGKELARLFHQSLIKAINE